LPIYPLFPESTNKTSLLFNPIAAGILTIYIARQALRLDMKKADLYGNDAYYTGQRPSGPGNFWIK
jgi:hypothetical protein